MPFSFDVEAFSNAINVLVHLTRLEVPVKVMHTVSDAAIGTRVEQYWALDSRNR
jgi:hypothetical protein